MIPIPRLWQRVCKRLKDLGAVAPFLGFLNLAAFSFISYLELPLLQFIFPILFFWVLPFLISYRVEGRDASALGLSLRSERASLYLLYTLLGFILTTLLLCMEFHLRTVSYTHLTLPTN